MAPDVTGASSSDGSDDETQAPILKILFRDKHNRSLKFFLHKSIYKAHQRKQVEKDIIKHGGRIVRSDTEADFVLILPGRANKDLIQTGYDASTDHRLNKVHVEYTTFIRNCIQENKVVITKRIKGMGGRPPGRWRNDFSYQDDENLSFYLSRLMPEKESGGRQGIGVYKRLMELAKAEPERYGWASRHTAESWKERYKRNQGPFDARINQLVQENPPTIKQRWPEDRRASQAKHKAVVELDSEGEEMESENEEDQQDISDGGNQEILHKRRRSERQSGATEPATKRRRVSSRHDPHYSDPRPSIGNKGKSRAIELPEEEEDELEEEEPFETPPEHFELQLSARSPERTLVASAQTKGPDISQETLRNTPPLDEGNASPLRQSSTRESRERSQQRRIERSSSPLFLSTAPFKPSPNDGFFLNMRRSSPIFTPESSPQPPASQSRGQQRSISPEIHPPPTLPQPKPPSQQPKRAARRPPPQPEQNDTAPYRNTRSRSRSVEPATLPSLPSKKARRPKEPIVEEEAEILDLTQMEETAQPSGQSPPMRETYVEEAIVENMLSAQTMEETNSGEHPRRQASLETDDAQVAATLRPSVPAPPQIRPRPGFNSMQKRPTAVLAQFQMTRPPVNVVRPPSTQRSDIGSTSRPSPLQGVRRAQEQSRHRDSLPFNFNFTTPSYDPHTPTQRSRKPSTSSVESFPPSGTRASAFKKNRQLQEKQTPYQPPPGTRASLLAKSR